MEDPEQARAYSEGDFAAAHDLVVADLLARAPELTRQGGLRVVDFGCGPADVTVRVARALPTAEVVGFDAGPRMLALGRERLARAGLGDRVVLHEARLPLDTASVRRIGSAFGAVISNSLLHHLLDPMDLWHAVVALGAPGAVVHVADLRRPAGRRERDRLVDVHAAGAPPVLVEDFRRSLGAAYRPEEIEAQLDQADLADTLRVVVVSDRHLVVTGRVPG